MKKYNILFTFLVFWQAAESQFQRTIPPENEVGSCRCQLMPPPSSGVSDLLLPHHTNVIFKLFTRSARKGQGVQIKSGDAASLANSGFNPSLPLTIITHGFQENPSDTPYILLMKDLLLDKENINVIVVDWSRMSRSVILPLVAKYAKYTGKLLGRFLHFLKNTYPGISGRRMHLIGFSYGAHISGIAGHLFPGIARITGLDPAGAAFECIPDSQRLDRSDADFVHVIHSNSGCLNTGHSGYRIPIGHQDFYPNGGGKQPGCNSIIHDALIYITTLNYPYLCHHHRAVQYFIESIRSKEVAYGYNCPSYASFKSGNCLGNTKAVIGYHATPGPEGVFFLSTQSEPTFLSKYLQIQVQVGSKGNGIEGQFSLQSTNRKGEAEMVSVIRNGQRSPRSDQVFTSMVTMPLDSSAEGMQFSVRYEPSRIHQGTANDILDILQIRAVDPVSRRTYCISSRESRQMSSQYYFRARLGAC